MIENILNNAVVGLIVLFISLTAAYGQDNNPDPMINLALVDGAVVTGSVPNDQARGIPKDILCIRK